MQKDIHPPYGEMTVELRDGSNCVVFTINSTKIGGKLLLDVDYRKHPAWNGNINKGPVSGEEVANFVTKYNGLIF